MKAENRRHQNIIIFVKQFNRKNVLRICWGQGGAVEKSQRYINNSMIFMGKVWIASVVKNLWNSRSFASKTIFWGVLRLEFKIIFRLEFKFYSVYNDFEVRI